VIFPCIDLMDGKVVQFVQGREKALEADSPEEMLDQSKQGTVGQSRFFIGIDVGWSQKRPLPKRSSTLAIDDGRIRAASFALPELIAVLGSW